MTKRGLKNMNRLLIALSTIAAILAGGTTLVLAGDDPILNAIKARQGIMQNRSWNVGWLFQMAKGDIEYDAETAATYANNLKMLTMLNNGSQWQEGSDSNAYAGDTRALPEIWTTYPAVAEKGKTLNESVAALAEVAGDGLDALRSKIGDVGNACKSCHDEFREEL
jgi:cytochrome c556